MPTIAESIRFGRVPRGRLGNAQSLTWDGETFTTSGRIEPADPSLVPRIREELLGLNNTVDTPVLPLDCLEDPTLDGYYTDVRCTVELDPGSNVLGHFSYSLTARRVPGRDKPRMELLTLGGLRANDHSIAAGAVQPWCAVPAAAVDAWDGEATAPPHAFDLTRACATATDGVGIYLYSTTGIDARLARFSVPPSAFYDGAAQLVIGDDPIVGRQLWTTDASTATWAVGNGIVTVTPSATTAGRVNVENLNTAGSATIDRDFDLIYYDSGTPLTIDAWTTLTVIRNTADLVIVRAGCRSGTRRELAALDITMRRGARIAELTFRTENSTAKKIVCTTPDAGASSTSRVNESAGPHRWVLFCPQTFTADTANGGLTATSSRVNVGVGHYDPSASGGDAIASVEDQYFGVSEPNLMIVGR